MKNNIDSYLDEKARLHGSLLQFIRVFFYLKVAREFDVSRPIGREPHCITICRALVKVLRGETKRLIINVPPRYGKTTLLIYFVAWALGRFPDSNFLYVSYSHSLAARQTAAIRDLMLLREYKEVFSAEVGGASRAKFDFETTVGGTVYAAGVGGTITGRGAGIKNVDRFGGAIIIDDAHKPIEVHSDTMREEVIEWYKNTLQSRRNNGRDTPVIFIGQRLHESDLPSYFEKEDIENWELLSLPALDAAGNALDPSMHTKEVLLEMQEHDPYNFSAQMQQNPQPAGGGIYKKDWFTLLDEDPEMLCTFITSDTAETAKTYNDATALSFWGLYEIKYEGEFTGVYGLHWIDACEIWVEPADLEDSFMQFYLDCMRYDVKPSVAAIEKKSTGVTLSSILKKLRGIQILNIERTKASGSKTTRFLEAQKFVAKGQISLTRGRKHTQMCIDHCGKITANDSHRRDDLCDTMYDAIKLGLIDQALIRMTVKPEESKTNEVIKDLIASQKKLTQIRSARKW